MTDGKRVSAEQANPPAPSGGNDHSSAAAQRREALLSAILDTAVDAIITIDEQARIQSFNPAAERMFGYAASEVSGHNVSLLMPSPYREEHDDYLQNYLRTGEKKIIGIGREAVGRRKDGSTFPLDLAVSEVRVGNVRLFTGIVRDISDRRRAEDRAAGLGRILDDSLNEIYIFDADTLRFVQVNRGARENLGYTMEELVQLTPVDLEREFTAPAFAALLEPLRSGEQTKLNFNTTHHRQDGSSYDVEVHLQMSTFESRSVFVAIALDVTDRREAEARLLQSERLAAIGQTVAGLAHESRNAFQRSQACLEMLAMELEGHADELELVERIQRALDHLHHLYEEVRDYAAPINIDRQPCVLSHVWRDAWTHLELARQRKRVALREETRAVNLTCAVDWFAMGQVFRNILENAVYSCPDPGEIVISCQAARLIGQPALEISIRDDGPGFEPEAREKVFTAFFTTKTKGTGLGMAIAKRIVDAHGGTIAVGEARSRGAEILITLPRS